jgi:hypothetical protein
MMCLKEIHLAHDLLLAVVFVSMIIAPALVAVRSDHEKTDS